jgi:dihydroorotate dehydrogenase (fumarate)
MNPQSSTMRPLDLISPPLVNSANPWATTLEQLKELYLCRYLGAITTRTCTLKGFPHDDAIHQYAVFDTTSLQQSLKGNSAAGVASLNTFGYSPYSLAKTLKNVHSIIEGLSDMQKRKPVIVSITGSTGEVVECIKLIQDVQCTLPMPLFVEINLSCPNIPDKPPPAFSKDGLLQYLNALHPFLQSTSVTDNGTTSKLLPLTIGIKTPPYSNPDNFTTLRAALLQSVNDSPSSTLPIRFITATNTLGCSFVPLPTYVDGHLASADGTGIGGLAGAPLHPLALGNVKMLREMLSKEDTLKTVEIVGVGGVSDRAGMLRMLNVGAGVVGVGTALATRGVRVFEEIWNTK